MSPSLVILVVALAAGAEPSPEPSPEPGAGRTRFEEASRKSAPRPSDVWSLLRDVPSVVLDRVDVGGSETALQSVVVSKGDLGPGTTFELDGFDITDPAAPGFVALFPDLDAAAAVEVRTSAWDARVRAPGADVRIGLPTAGDRLSGAAHLRGSGAAFRSDNTPDALARRPRTQVEHLYEAGAHVAGPAGGSLRYFLAASFQDLRQQAFTGHDESLRLDTQMGRVQLRTGAGETSLLAVRGAKLDDDRDPTLQAAPESRWSQSGTSWLLGARDSRRAGSAQLSTQLAWLDGGFRLDPHGGDAQASEDASGVFRGSYQAFETERERLEARLAADVEPRLLGRPHRIQAGLGWSRARVRTRGAWPGDGVVAYARDDVFFRTFRLSGFAQLTRDQDVATTADRATAYLQDRVRFGRVEVGLGLRFDRQTGRSQAASAAANELRPDLLPGLRFDGADADVRVADLLPRVAVALDLGVASRLRADYAAYGAWLGAADAGFDDPLRDVASLTYLWRDADADALVDADEVLAARGLQGSSGLDPANPGSATSPHAIDPGLRAPRTHEWALAFEHRVGSWSGRLVATLRRRDDAAWQPLRGLTRADYGAVVVVDGTLFGQPYSETAWAPFRTSAIVPGNGRLLTNRADYREDYSGVEAEVAGRVGADGRVRAWAAWMDTRQRFDTEGAGVQDPTPTDAEPLRDGGALAVRPGGLGRGDVFVHAGWAAGAEAELGLPAGLRAALLFHARDGFPIPYYEVALTGDPTGGAKPVLVSTRLDEHRLPALVQLDLRLAREFAAGPGRLRLAVDAFNVLNGAATLQAARDVELPVPGRARELQRPRMLRLGLDFRF